MIKSGREKKQTDQSDVIIRILGRRESQSCLLLKSYLLFKNRKKNREILKGVIVLSMCIKLCSFQVPFTSTIIPENAWEVGWISWEFTSLKALCLVDGGMGIKLKYCPTGKITVDACTLRWRRFPHCSPSHAGKRHKVEAGRIPLLSCSKTLLWWKGKGRLGPPRNSLEVGEWLRGKRASVDYLASSSLISGQPQTGVKMKSFLNNIVEINNHFFPLDFSFP